MERIKQLICPHIVALKPYSSARSEYKGNAKIFLDANENALQAPYNRYPDPLQLSLKAVIAPLLGVESNQLFLGNGSDEAIDILLRTFCVAGKDAIVLMPPTYGMYEVAARTQNIQVLKVPLNKNFQPNVEAILAAQTEQTKLLFICSPNNPTGNDIKLEAIEQLLEGFKGIVVVDEAYIHFSTQLSCVSWLERYSNLVILQTFSKAWGMAGLRLGMALANPYIIQFFNKVKAPYNINTLTQAYVLEQLQKNHSLDEEVAAIVQEKKYLEQALKQFSFVQHIYPSAANFLLIKVTEANRIYQDLVKEGIIIRNRSTVLLCDNCLRITIGTPAENRALVNCLSKLIVK